MDLISKMLVQLQSATLICFVDQGLLWFGYFLSLSPIGSRVEVCSWCGVLESDGTFNSWDQMGGA